MSTYQKQEVVTLKDIRQSIIAGKNSDAVTIAKALINKGIKPKEILVDGVTKAMEHLSKKCTIEEFNLLELMLAGRAAMDTAEYIIAEGIKKCDSSIERDLYPENRNIVLGTIKGDIHEIGKNIVSMVFRSHGYEVIDMGKDVDPNDLVMAAIKHKADVIGVSGLITTIIPHVREVRRYAMKRGLHTIKIIAGGAALQQATSEYLNVDYVADNVFDGLDYIKSL